jgi:hypothetical protein
MVMKKLVIAACVSAIALLAAGASQAEGKKNCVRGYSKTAEEAFALGVKLAKSKDVELGVENQLLADTRIRILPEKMNGLFVVEVYSSRKGICDLKLDDVIKTADTVDP